MVLLTQHSKGKGEQMSDKGKLVLTGSDDVQSIARMVKRAREQEKVIKFKIARQTVHVEFVDDPEQGMDKKYLLQETGLLSCSPDVIAQSIFDDYLKPANLTPVSRCRGTHLGVFLARLRRTRTN